MTTMSDDGERTCPLCAEEMDMTDQQLKPCKCGYEICVWCWHHIIEMAEKEDTEGRCPACRTPYDKERIVGTATNCERMVVELNAEKRQKSQKARSKSSLESRKHLSSVRVIQRNLVYIIGLPSNLCDENLLERKEFFGQYGRVLKVSISRPTTAAAALQAANNNTFSVYITYAKEEEAVRCIQAVHNFVLDGKPLRACFGTTKYCHSWLRNMNCSNPDCMYLHDIGSQEDSFTKDEIISAYTRSRVPQVASNNLQRRSGSVLPPPVDDMCSNDVVSGKHAVVRNGQNQCTIVQAKISSNCNNAGKTNVLPPAASWGLQANGRQPPAKSLEGILKPKTDLANGSSNTKASSAWHDDATALKVPEGRHATHRSTRPMTMKIPSFGGDDHTSEESQEDPLDVCQDPVTSAWDDDNDLVPPMEPVGNNVKNIAARLQFSEQPAQRSSEECRTSPQAEYLSASEVPMTSSTSSIVPASSQNGLGFLGHGNGNVLTNGMSSKGYVSPANISTGCIDGDGTNTALCSEFSTLKLDKFLQDNSLEVASNHSSVSYPTLGSASLAISSKPTGASDAISLVQPYVWDSESERQHHKSNGSNFNAVDDHNLGYPDAAVQPFLSTHSNELHQIVDNTDRSSWNSILPTQVDDGFLLGGQSMSSTPNGHIGDKLRPISREIRESSYINYSKGKANDIETFNSVVNVNKSSGVDMGEGGIISDILSLDFDPWDDSLSAANNLARLLGESGRQEGTFQPLPSWKLQNSGESRFSFARQESEGSSMEPPVQILGHAQTFPLSSQDVYSERSQNRFLSNSFGSSNSPAVNQIFGLPERGPLGLSDRAPGAPKAKISAPPGFSIPNRSAPPGFSTQDRHDHRNGALSDHCIGDFPLRSQNQVHLSENTADVEFIDPAILAVGKGRLPLGVNTSGFNLTPPFTTQLNSFERDPRLQLLMQQSISAQPEVRFSDLLGDSLSLNESFTSSRLLAQSSNISSFGRALQQSRDVGMSNGQWDSWTGNDIGMSDNLRNDRFGLPNFFRGNEEPKFHMTNSGNVYNQAFRMQ